MMLDPTMGFNDNNPCFAVKKNVLRRSTVVVLKQLSKHILSNQTYSKRDLLLMLKLLVFLYFLVANIAKK